MKVNFRIIHINSRIVPLGNKLYNVYDREEIYK